MSSSLVFVDRAIANYPFLTSGIDPTATVVLLDSQQDGVAQISAVLAAQDALEAVHLFSHGAPGTLQLGATTLSLDSIDSYDLAPWQKALRHANLLIYGCRVAAGETGDRFLHTLHQRTGANIAASATLTGSSAQGGDWNLERRIGAIDRLEELQPGLLRPDVMAEYDGILQLAIPNLLFGAVTDESNPQTPSELVIVGIGGPFEGQIDRSLPPLFQRVTLPFETFALARQAETGNLYYIETERSATANGFTSGRVGFYDFTTGQNQILANPTGIGGAGNQFVKMAQQVGTGRIFAMNSSTPDLYIIDVAGADAGRAIDLDPIAFGDPGTLPIGSGDIAFDPNDPNRLFATVTRPDIAANVFQLYVIDVSDPTPGNVSASFVGNVRLPDGTPLSDVGAGSLAFGQDGNLFLTSDQDGNPATADDVFLYRIDETTAIVENADRPIPVQLGEGQRINDFATLPTITEQIDLVLTKTDSRASVAAGDPITYTITVTNTRADVDIPNIRLTDFVEGLTNVTWTGRFSGGAPGNLSGFLPGSQSGTGDVDVRFNLGAQATVIYTLRGTVDPNSPLGSTLSNTAVVELPPGLNDPNPTNNTVTDTTTIGTVTQPDDPDDESNCVRGINRRGAKNRNNRLLGDNDINRLTGGSRRDVLRGFGCPDTLIGNRGRDTLRGGDARDNLQGNQDNDRLNGGRGNDRMNGGLGNDTLLGDDGNDSMRGGSGRDRMVGGAGADRMVGNEGNDVMRGNRENDVMIGRLDNDRLNGNRGNDTLRGNLGRDRCGGGAGNDLVDGGGGNDVLFGGGGNDRLLGNLGLDVLVAGSGNDTLIGQARRRSPVWWSRIRSHSAGGGADRVEGGAQADI
ncbi:MAG: DUF4347 domain-containing protein, partial [Leptolyngbyaceae cyanobacterium SM1_3_5]|nr:DUF4347 domain-containing protein [Leptolyngbyaceae cyanobacterium SM1_3_5]